MRYPITLIPGLPVTPDVGIGVQLTPVVPVSAPAAAAASAAAAGEVGAYWAFSPSASDTLTIERGGTGGAVDNTTGVSTPPDAFVNDFGYSDAVLLLAVAIVRDAPDGAVIAWDISAPVADYGDTPVVADLGDGNYDIAFGGADHYSLRVTGNKVSCFYTYPRSVGSSYAAWGLTPITLTPSVDGTPLRTLTLNASALAFVGF